VIARRHRIELAKQCEKFVGLVPGEKCDVLGGTQGICWSAPTRWRSRCEEIAAGIRLHPIDARGKQVGQRGEVGHRRRLATVERILNGAAPPASFRVNEVRHIARRNAQLQWRALDRHSVDELRVCPDGRDGSELVDDHACRRLATHHGQKHDRRIIAGRLVSRSSASGCREVEARIGRRSRGPYVKSAIVVRLGLRELPGCVRTCSP